jgi:hypothetical protein
MQFSPRRSWLYRSRQPAVTFLATITALALALASSHLEAQGPIIQYGQKGKVDKGPRALGLVQIPAKGKARLVPIAIMVDGKFYDADSYKAAPIPMALDFGVVYEAFHAGVSQGILTISQPGQLNHTWIAEGTWLPAGLRAQEKTKKYSPPVIEDSEGPPVLHRRNSTDANENDKHNDKDKEKGGEEAKGKDVAKNTDAKDKAPGDQPKDQQKPGTGAPSAPATGASTPAKPANAEPTKSDNDKTSSSEEPLADPNRPRLRRGRPDPSARRDVYTKFEALLVPAPASAVSDPAKPGGTTSDTSSSSSSIVQVTIFPAISDAGGPEARPYVYDIKPAEEGVYRKKMLDLAATQFRGPATSARESGASSKKTSTFKTTGKNAVKLPKPEFDDVSVRFFDLSNSNEPVLVLSAKTRPADSNASENLAEPKEIMLIARTNLEGEVKKLFFSQTDSRHLDQSPRMELIDVVDADGDGRGELLFRRVFDTGSAYAIYRVTSDRLWPLFEGTP